MIHSGNLYKTATAVSMSEYFPFQYDINFLPCCKYLLRYFTRCTSLFIPDQDYTSAKKHVSVNIFLFI